MPRPKRKRESSDGENDVNQSSSVVPIDTPIISESAAGTAEADEAPTEGPEDPQDDPIAPEAAITAEAPVRISAVQISDKPFPRPPRFDCEPQDFFTYWNSLDAGQLARSMVYCYRTYPVLDHTRGLSPEEVMAIRDKKKRLRTNIDKLVNPISAKYWYEELLQRWGSGDYHLKLNDAGIRNNERCPPRQICQTNVRGLRDFEHHPPNLPLSKLSLDDPLNKSYIEFLRVKGIPVPGLDDDEKDKKETEDMAAAERLAETVEKLAERNTVLAADSAARLAAVQAGSKDKDRPIEVNSQAALAAIDVVKSASAAALDMQNRAAEAQAKTQDPVVYFDNVLKAADRLKPAGGDAGNGGNAMDMMMRFFAMMQESNRALLQEIRESSKAVVEAQNSRIQFTEQIAKDALARASNAQTASPAAPGVPPATPAVPPDPLAGTLKVLDVVDKIAERMGIGARTSEGPWWARPAMTLAASIPTAISYAAYNAAVAKTGTGTPQLPPQQPGEGEEIEDGAPALAGPPQQGQAVNPYIQFLQSIHKPLVNALDQNLPGFVFAGNLVVSNGWGIYDQLHAAGKEQIFTLLQSYPPLWQDVIKVPARFDQFLNEFLDRERVAQAAEEFRIAQDAAKEGPPPAPTKVKVTPKQPKPSGPLPQAVVDAKANEAKAG